MALFTAMLLTPACLFGQGPAAAEYAPRPGAAYVLPDGSIQLVVARGMTSLIESLNALFLKTHPGVRFTMREGDNYSGMAALTFDVTAFAPLTSEYTRIGLGDNLKIAPEPAGFRIAHASLQPGARLSPLAVIVAPGNPLDHLTMDQFTRIFAAGGPSSDLTRWSQLGIPGPLAGEDLHPCGPPATDYTAFEDPQAGEYLSLRKMNGLSFNHAYQPLADYAAVLRRVASDPAAIGIVALNQVTPAVKVVALAGQRAGKPYRGSAGDIEQGRYPLDRYLYLYLRANPGLTFDPFAREYLRLALSPEGQHAIAAGADGYLPLNARELAEEQGRLEP